MTPYVDARRGVGSLSHHLSLFDADSEAELNTGMRKAVNQSLKCFFRVCHQGCVIGKEGLSDGYMPDLGLGSEPGQVEQPAVGSSVQVDSVFVPTEGVSQEHREEDPKECGGEHTALLDSTADWEWL